MFVVVPADTTPARFRVRSTTSSANATRLPYSEYFEAGNTIFMVRRLSGLSREQRVAVVESFAPSTHQRPKPAGRLRNCGKRQPAKFLEWDSAKRESEAASTREADRPSRRSPPKVCSR